MAHSYVQIEKQDISNRDAEVIAIFLQNQPEWLWHEVNQGVSWEDFEQWSDTKVDRDHLIMPGELFICDLELGELWIARLRRKNGSGFKADKVYQLSDNMRRDYGNNFNGYAVLPKHGRDIPGAA